MIGMKMIQSKFDSVLYGNKTATLTVLTLNVRKNIIFCESAKPQITFSDI